MKTGTALSLASLAAAIALSGCATKMRPEERARVYVTPGGAMSFAGATVTDPAELPRRLSKAGATPQNEILIITQGDVEEEELRRIAASCGLGGLPNVVISERKAPVSLSVIMPLKSSDAVPEGTTMVASATCLSTNPSRIFIICYLAEAAASAPFVLLEIYFSIARQANSAADLSFTQPRR